jgi:hypothetical protein
MRQHVSTNHGHLQAMQYHKKWKYNNLIKMCVKHTEYQNILNVKTYWISKYTEYQNILNIKTYWISEHTEYQNILNIKTHILMLFLYSRVLWHWIAWRWPCLAKYTALLICLIKININEVVLTINKCFFLSLLTPNFPKLSQLNTVLFRDI